MKSNYFEKSKKQQKNPYKAFNKGFKEFRNGVFSNALLWAESAKVLEKHTCTIDEGSLTMPYIDINKMDIPNSTYHYEHFLSFDDFHLNHKFKINHIEVCDYGIVDSDNEETLIQDNKGSTFSMGEVDVKPKKQEYRVHCCLEGTVRDIYDLSSSRALSMKLDIWGYLEPVPKWKKYTFDALRQLNKNKLEEAYDYLFNAFEALLPQLVPPEMQKKPVYNKLQYLQDKSKDSVPLYVSAFRLARNHLTHDKESMKANIKKKDIFIFLLLIRELAEHKRFFELPIEQNSLLQLETDLIRKYGAIHMKNEEKRLREKRKKEKNK